MLTQAVLYIITHRSGLSTCWIGGHVPDLYFQIVIIKIGNSNLTLDRNHPEVDADIIREYFHQYPCFKEER